MSVQWAEIGVILGTGATVVTGYFTFRAQSGAIRSDTSNKREARIDDRIESYIARLEGEAQRSDQLRESLTQLQTMYSQAIARIDALEQRRERDALMISDLQRQLDTRGTTT